MKFTFAEIEKITGAEFFSQGNKKGEVRCIDFHTSRLQGNSLYIALTNGERDGHQFIKEAKSRGAIAAIISNPEYKDLYENDIAIFLVEDTLKALHSLATAHRQKLKIPIIAITGSNGKTTAKDMISNILEYKKKVFRTPKNFNNHLGLPLSILQIDEEFHQVAVLEMGMNHAGEIDLLAKIAKPDIGIITNIGDAHIGNFKSKDEIANAKGELLAHISRRGYVLLNGDDPYANHLSGLYRGKPYLYGIENKTLDIRAFDVEYSQEGMYFNVITKDQHFKMYHTHMELYGKHNVYNVLPAIYIASKLGMTVDEIKESIQFLKPSSMRFEVSEEKNGAIIVNDSYNASPTSMKAAIETFSNMYKKKKKIVVLGDMFELGEESKKRHAEVGEYLNKFKDKFHLLITVGNDASNISKAYNGSKLHFETKEEAVKRIKEFKTGEYALLFKASRGMKMEELITDLK